MRISRETRKTNVHDAIVPTATVSGVDWSIQYRKRSSAVAERFRETEHRLLPIQEHSARCTLRKMEKGKVIYYLPYTRPKDTRVQARKQKITGRLEQTPECPSTRRWNLARDHSPAVAATRMRPGHLVSRGWRQAFLRARAGTH